VVAVGRSIGVAVTSFVVIAFGIAGCAVITVALVLAVWAIAQNRRPPST
jgi:hypothetical protein